MNIKGENPIIIIPRKNGSVFFSIVNMDPDIFAILFTTFILHGDLITSIFVVQTSGITNSLE